MGCVDGMEGGGCGKFSGNLDAAIEGKKSCAESLGDVSSKERRRSLYSFCSKAMKFVFPYGEKEGRQYPLVDITLSHQKNSLTVRALVDSGATFSVFRPEIADFLKIKIEKGQQMYLEGVGGRILGYLHTVKVAVGGKSFPCKFVFSREFTVSLNILGRDNFFSEFLITFDEENGYTILER